MKSNDQFFLADLLTLDHKIIETVKVKDLSGFNWVVVRGSRVFAVYAIAEDDTHAKYVEIPVAEIVEDKDD